jgi:hypothetical protein
LTVVAAGALCPLPAQSKALLFSIHGGRHNPLVNLTDAGDDFSAAFSYGGSLGLQLSERVAVRGMVTRHRARYRGETFAVADSMTTQYSYGLDLQVGWPATSALVPYVYVGGGGYRVEFDDDAVSSSNSFAGRFGIGLNRVGRLGAWFVEIGTALYEFKSPNFKRVQFELETRLGFALALGI